MSYLLSFSIGPIQPFIATARRTQDFWLGSRLLSDMMLAGLEAIINGPKLELIFPAGDKLREAKEYGGLPHKFLAVCDDPDQVAEVVQKAIKDHWQNRAQEVKNKILTQLSVEDETIWKRQTDPDKLIEFYWAAVQFVPQKYQDCYKAAGQILGARKTLRNFVQVKEGGVKCRVCGERTGLIDSHKIKNALRSSLVLKPNEKLCAVCTIKRFDAKAQGKEENFPSTSTVAVAPFLLELLSREKEVQPHLGLFQQALYNLETQHPQLQELDRRPLTNSAHPVAIPTLKDKGDEAIRCLDGDLFFDDTFNLQGRLKNDYGFLESTAADKIEKVRSELKKLLDVIKQQANVVPTPYFALLLMDGDRMGKRLLQTETKEAHQVINRSLFEFTGEVRQIVEAKYLGRLVYAGGDDVFALLPMSQALPAANEIRLAFGRHLPGATMSAGVAMAHHLAPLSFVRQQVVEAEKAAKNHYKRDALCVTLLKRSGAPLTVGATWHSCVTDLIADLVDHFRSERLSAKIAFDLDRIAPVLIGDPFPHEARVAEVRRLLRRHRDNQRCDEPAKTAIDGLAERLVVLGPEMADWLKVARFLAGGGQDE